MNGETDNIGQQIFRCSARSRDANLCTMKPGNWIQRRSPNFEIW